MVEGEEQALTCTGLSYDAACNTWWIGCYGKTNQGDKYGDSIIVQMDYSFQKIVSVINLTQQIEGLNENIQGVAIDKSDDSIWFADSLNIYNISKQGDLRKVIKFKDQYKKPNGIAYDTINDSLWVLFFSNYLVEVDKDGTILNEYPCNIEGQDQLYCSEVDGKIYFTAGTDYLGNQNFVYKYDFDKQVAIQVYQLMDSYAVEGIVLKNKELWIANDGYYHCAYEPVNIVKKYVISE